MSASPLPERFATVAELEDCLSEPTPELAADLAKVPGDILVLGVAGKMGPTLARMAKRAAPDKRVVGVARFSDQAVRTGLEAVGHRDHRLRPAASPRRRGPAEAAQRRLHGGHEVRRVRQSGADLGHERARPHHRRRGLRRLAHRRLLDGVRLPVRAGGRRRRHRGHARRAAAGRLRLLLPRPRAHVRAFLGAAGHSPAAWSGSTTPSTCATACCTTSAPRCWAGSRSTSPWATSTSSGRAMPTRSRCAAWRTRPRPPLRSTSRGRRRCASAGWRRSSPAASAAPRQFTGSEAPTGWLNDASRMVAELGAAARRHRSHARLDRRLALPRHGQSRQADPLRGARWPLLTTAAGAAPAPGRSSACSRTMPRACARCRSRPAGTRWRPTGASCWTLGQGYGVRGADGQWIAQRAVAAARARPSPGSAWCW